MGSQKIVLIVAAIILIGGVGWYFLEQDERGGEMTTESETGDVEEDSINTQGLNGSFAGTGSLLDILSLGRSVTCTYSYRDENGEGSGTSYFAGERMRVDSTYTQEGNAFESHMINDTENLYSWTISNEGSFAFVTPVEAFEDQNQDSETGPQSDTEESVDLNAQVEYDCRNWSVDESLFVPPSSVDFVDMSAMFEGMLEGMPEGFPERMEGSMMVE